jgi:hypothetical protein
MTAPWRKKFDLIVKCEDQGPTRAGFPAPTISSKFVGVKSITLLANVTLSSEAMNATYGANENFISWLGSSFWVQLPRFKGRN